MATTKNAHVYSQIGMEYGKQGNYPEALEALATAEKSDPKFAMTYVYRGNIFEVQGDNAAPRPRNTAGPSDRRSQYNQAARDGLTRLGQ